ncbi:MAG: protein translocase subunit SecF [Peptococcaceae bacterium]|jgi:preprotein translocase subunit SecF|nr:protein translocase subunit SecF [Peptococcaceae bacterium]
MFFYEKRKFFYLIAVVCLAVGLVSLALQGLNQGIDFRSGTLMDIRFTGQAVSIEQVRDVLGGFSLENSAITQDGEGTFVIKSAEIMEETQTEILTAFTEALGEYELLRTESVGPVVGRELTINGLIALALAAVLMIVYISLRFQWKYAIAAIVCLLHDVLIMLGFFALFQFEVESSFIAAVLTIIGYSINNTIVIFDRIRENLRGGGRPKGGELVDRSIRQTLRRSVNMFVTTVMVLLCLIFLGGDTTRVFAVALLVGNVAGCFSSVFLSANLWLEMKPKGLRA